MKNRNFKFIIIILLISFSVLISLAGCSGHIQLDVDQVNPLAANTSPLSAAPSKTDSNFNNPGSSEPSVSGNSIAAHNADISSSNNESSYNGNDPYTHGVGTDSSGELPNQNSAVTIDPNNTDTCKTALTDISKLTTSASTKSASKTNSSIIPNKSDTSKIPSASNTPPKTSVPIAPTAAKSTLTISETKLTMALGDQKNISVYGFPADVINTVSWKVSSPFKVHITTFSYGTTFSGNFYALSDGTFTVTASTPDGKYSASCTITISKPSTTGFINEVLKLVNQERSKKSLTPLTLNTAVCTLADIRAKELDAYFHHDRPNGTAFWTVLSDIPYSKAAENIAMGQYTPEEAMTGWMNSTGHRDAILGNYDQIGIGIYYSDGIIYWVQLFIKN